MSPGAGAGLRTFVALFPPLDIAKQSCSRADELLRSSRVRIVAPERFHLTLCFLGHLELGEPEQVAHEIAESARSCAPFFMNLGAGGVFAGPGGRQILWAGPSRESLQPLCALREAVVGAAERAGIAPAERESAWTPHLTLARAQRQVSGEARREFESSSFGNGPRWSAKEVCVALSGPGLTGPYPLVSRVTLGA